MNVIFLEPSFPASQREFVRALAAIGARVHGIGERPVDWLDGELRSWLASYRQIGSIADEAALEHAVREAQGEVWIDRLETVVEAHVMAAARVRERTGIPGTSTRTAWLCRDKPAMKEALRAAGVPCAASAGIASAGEAREFVREHGYPIVIKPRDSAGAAGTWRCDDDDALANALDGSGVERGATAAIEEFVEGHEGFLDTLAVNGQPRHEFVSHYYPNVLDAMRTRWISPQIVATNRIDDPAYEEVRAMNRRVVETLGIETSATHMEWFFGPKGLRFSEIGCRPPGVGQWDSYCAGNDMDLYRDWALAVCHHVTEATASRSHACGIIAFRPERDGRVFGYDGTEKIFEKYGHLVVGQHFPEPGTPTQGVEAGYMANAWMRVRHSDFDALRGILAEMGQHVRVRAG